MICSAEVSNDSERASNVLLSNVRLNRKTGNRRKRTGWTKNDKTGNQTDGVEKRANGVQRKNGTGENAGRKRSTQGTGRKDGTSDARRNGKRDGQDGAHERVARSETERRKERAEAD